jgi:hypothetical protein
MQTTDSIHSINGFSPGYETWATNEQKYELKATVGAASYVLWTERYEIRFTSYELRDNRHEIKLCPRWLIICTMVYCVDRRMILWCKSTAYRIILNFYRKIFTKVSSVRPVLCSSRNGVPLKFQKTLVVIQIITTCDKAYFWPLLNLAEHQRF